MSSNIGIRVALYGRVNSVPPPLPIRFEPAEPSTFPRQAANACLAAPIIMIVLSMCMSAVLQGHRDGSGRSIALIFGAADCLLVFTGVVLGILSMVLAKSGQRGAVIPRAVIGLVISGLLAAIAVPNFVRARNLALQRRQALEDLHATADEYRAQAVASLTNSHQQPVDSQQLQQSLNRAANKTSGETAALLRASQLYLGRMQAYQRNYEQASRALLAGKVLGAANLQQRAQIQDRKALVLAFLNANDGFKAFLKNGESNYRKELSSSEISAEQKEAAVAGFHKTFTVQTPLLLAIRDADDRMGEAMLGVLNLFDAQWGKWRYDTQAGLVRFEDHAAVAQYNALLAEINDAATRQSTAQKQLAAVLSGPNTAM